MSELTVIALYIVMNKVHAITTAIAIYTTEVTDLQFKTYAIYCFEYPSSYVLKKNCW